ncbi:MAG: T9SS type A sorting domain-containing protein [Bacteroidia bacterium]|nr:T9SS type A sorting domain-containing protein [Bacteroidia bacterium]
MAQTIQQNSLLINNDSQTELTLVNFETNSSKDFFSINSSCFIQQWSLSNGTVTGGDTILSGGGTSLGFCGNINNPTFYTNDWNIIGIKHYDADSGWITTPTQTVVDNNGGHLNDQYYQVVGAVIQIIKYWDGTNLSTVDSLNGEFFAGTHDMAVDTLGRAWVFIGSSPSNIDSIRVYDRHGRLFSYPINFNQTAHSSFFLNDTLYIATAQNFIYPVLISGSTAQLGNPIAFPIGSITDMASCQFSQTINSIQDLSTDAPTLYPNPTNGLLFLPVEIASDAISLFNSKGQSLNVKRIGTALDLNSHAAGIYFIRIEHDGKFNYQKIIKQ